MKSYKKNLNKKKSRKSNLKLRKSKRYSTKKSNMKGGTVPPLQSGYQTKNETNYSEKAMHAAYYTENPLHRRIPRKLVKYSKAERAELKGLCFDANNLPTECPKNSEPYGFGGEYGYVNENGNPLNSNENENENEN